VIFRKKRGKSFSEIYEEMTKDIHRDIEELEKQIKENDKHRTIAGFKMVIHYNKDGSIAKIETHKIGDLDNLDNQK